MSYDLRSVVDNFCIRGEFVTAAPYGCGHINDTFAVVVNEGKSEARYIFQRINQYTFKDPAKLMDNISRVTVHQQLKLEGVSDARRRSLTLISTRSGGSHHVDKDGHFWRCYIFIEGASTYDIIETPEQAFLAAQAFGLFQKNLLDLPGERLHETIPDFHNTPKRFKQFQQALELDPCNRAVTIKEEIDFVLDRESITGKLLDLHANGDIPERITHNDTKLNNLMIDDESRQGICVLDLDTVMPGLALYDFGDLVRTGTSPVAEDETNLSKVYMQMHMYKALVEGYLSAAGEFLKPAEKAHLAFAGRLITFETGIRFLTDYLEGDVYFKTHRQGHNLDRCRTQFRLVASIEEQEEAMNCCWHPPGD
jgi:Ser/Thr protein kinase RdoA (MazF antagonist)